MNELPHPAAGIDRAPDAPAHSTRPIPCLEKTRRAGHGRSPASWAAGSLIMLVTLACEIISSWTPFSSFDDPGRHALVISVGLLLWASALSSTRGARSWIRENASSMLPACACLLVAPICLAAVVDLLFGLSASGWRSIWCFTTMIGIPALIFAVAAEDAVDPVQITTSTLACFGGSVLAWMMLESLSAVAFLLSLVAAASLAALWSHLFPLDELLAGCEEDESDEEIGAAGGSEHDKEES